MSRRLVVVLAVLLVVAGLVAACRGTQGEAGDAAAELALGGQAYLAQCSVCHGAYGEGDGPLAASIVAEQRPQPPNLTSTKVRDLGRRGVVRVLAGEAHRRPGAPMPLWGPHLGSEWMNRIADYVVKMPTLGEEGRAAVAHYLAAPEGTSGAGRRTYVAYCSSCHGPEGGGEAFFTPKLGLVPPPLDADVVRALTDEEVAKFLAPGGRHLELAPNVPGWLYTMAPSNRAELVAYLRVLGTRSGN